MISTTPEFLPLRPRMASDNSDLHSVDIASTNQSMDSTTQDESARTRALANQDILQVIFCHLRAVVDPGDTANPKSKSVLRRPALVCKAFMEPALDSLWWSMTSLMPLLKLLRNFQMIEGMANTYTFYGKFSDQDLTRFDYYSRRVREFDYHSVPAQQIDAAALIRLAQYRPFIYPHLQKIVWKTALSPLIILLVSPTLTSLDIRNSADDSSAMITFLSAILSNLPQSPTTIALRGSVSAIYLALIPKMTSLSTVIIPNLGASGSTAFLYELAALEGLENLHINLQSPVVVRSTYRNAPPDYVNFPALRTLCISGQLDLIHTFVTEITSTQVVSISVSSQCTGTLVLPFNPFRRRTNNSKSSEYRLNFPDLLSKIANQWPHLSRMDFDLPNMSPEDHDTGLYELLGPILKCSLVDISIRGFSRVSCSDDDLCSIVSNLRNARVISLPFSPFPIIRSYHLPGPTPKAPTICGLRSLAAWYCPDLTSLQLSIDTGELPALTGEPLSHGLKTLSVGDSPVEDEFRVADHLDYIFPYLEKIYGIDSDAVEHRGWKLVENILHSRQAARRVDERRRAGRVGGA